MTVSFTFTWMLLLSFMAVCTSFILYNIVPNLDMRFRENKHLRNNKILNSKIFLNGIDAVAMLYIITAVIWFLYIVITSFNIKC